VRGGVRVTRFRVRPAALPIESPLPIVETLHRHSWRTVPEPNPGERGSCRAVHAPLAAIRGSAGA